MDWENKFYSIVQETEANLSKAKDKLTGISGKSFTLPNSSIAAYPWLSAPYYKPSGTVSSDSSLLKYYTLTPQAEITEMSLTQMLHMKEQIDSQNKTIEKLQKLIRSLDNERDFYKQQIANLKDKVDSLTDKMNTSLTLTNSEWKMSSMKRDVMREIEKVKYMLQDCTRDSASSAYDKDLWKAKENMTDSLGQIRQELSAMNKKIERLNLESHHSPSSFDRKESISRKLQNSFQHQRFPPLYSPVSISADPSCLELQKLRLAINSINSKLDSLEKRIEAPLAHSFYHSRTTGLPYVSEQRQHPTLSLSDVNGDQSLSDLSSLSSLSDEESSELLDDFSYRSRFETSSRKKFKRNTRSNSKRMIEPYYRTKENVDLSDLELSDGDSDRESEDLD
ncbi:unnamed protein product [Lymnaea stagnalis]|uniref:Uncharacterized protein n=1 Tax=Lymnaea stagnalis TaxID=6523 RepID=A0AAV2IRN4_LYMST